MKIYMNNTWAAVSTHPVKREDTQFTEKINIERTSTVLTLKRIIPHGKPNKIPCSHEHINRQYYSLVSAAKIRAQLDIYIKIGQPLVGIRYLCKALCQHSHQVR